MRGTTLFILRDYFLCSVADAFGVTVIAFARLLHSSVRQTRNSSKSLLFHLAVMYLFKGDIQAVVELIRLVGRAAFG